MQAWFPELVKVLGCVFIIVGLMVSRGHAQGLTKTRQVGAVFCFLVGAALLFLPKWLPSAYAAASIEDISNELTSGPIAMLAGAGHKIMQIIGCVLLVSSFVQYRHIVTTLDK